MPSYNEVDYQLDEANDSDPQYSIGPFKKLHHEGSQAELKAPNISQKQSDLQRMIRQTANPNLSRNNDPKLITQHSQQTSQQNNDSGNHKHELTQPRRQQERNSAAINRNIFGVATTGSGANHNNRSNVMVSGCFGTPSHHVEPFNPDSLNQNQKNRGRNEESNLGPFNQIQGISFFQGSENSFNNDSNAHQQPQMMMKDIQQSLAQLGGKNPEIRQKLENLQETMMMDNEEKRRMRQLVEDKLRENEELKRALQRKEEENLLSKKKQQEISKKLQERDSILSELESSLADSNFEDEKDTGLRILKLTKAIQKLTEQNETLHQEMELKESGFDSEKSAYERKLEMMEEELYRLQKRQDRELGISNNSDSQNETYTNGDVDNLRSIIQQL